ncbi:MAG: hypothetical protein WC979_00910 [Candidatus Pacearchaeota archaeon]|nr:hypothetical protein [Clostridia bacterium]
MAAPDTTSLLKGILNVVTRTEKHIEDINKKMSSSKAKGGDADDAAKSVTAAAKGSTGGNTSAETNKKLDTIINLLKIQLGDSTAQPNLLNGFGASILSIAAGLKGFSKANKGAPMFISFLKEVADPLKKLGTKAVTQGISNMDVLGNAILGFSKNMLKTGLLLLPVLPVLPIFAIVLQAMGGVFTKIGQKSKDIEKGSKVMGDMGKGMIFLAGGIAMLSLSAVLSSVALSKFGFPTGAIGIIGGVALLCILLNIPPIKKGVSVLKDIGKGMLYLAGGIAILSLSFALSAMVMKGASVGGTLGAGLGIISAVGGLALMMVFLGMPPVEKGAKALKTMGAGMIFLALGIAIMGLSIALISKYAGVSPLEVGASIAIAVTGIGGAMYLLGKNASNIFKGSIALAVTSLALVVFGYGLKTTFDALKGKSWEDLAKLGTSVVGIAAAVTLIGNPITAGFTLIGAGLLAAIGGSLWAVAKGMKSYMDLGADQFPGDQFKTTMGQLKDGFMVLLGDDADAEKQGGGIWGALKSVGKTALNTGKMTMAVMQAIGIGAALSSMAKGIGAWANLQNIQLISGYDKNGNPIYSGERANISQAIDNVITFIGDGKTGGIMLPFITLSNTANLSKSGDFSLLKFITGNDLSNSPFSMGISAAVKIGDVLTSLATGVGSWMDLQNIPLIDHYDNKGKPVYKGKANINVAIEQIKTVLTPNSGQSILDPFISLAQNTGILTKPDSFNLFKLISGNDLSDSPFQLGISSALKIGKVLTSIAEGIGAWAQLESIPLITGYNKDGNPIYGKTVNANGAIANIGAFMPKILALFSNFADTGSGSTWSVAKMLVGTDMSETPTERGISNALKIGDVLTKIAGGINVFANMQAIPIISGYDAKGNPIIAGHVNIDAAIANAGTAITKIINTLSNAATGGTDTGGGSLWSKVKNAVKSGVKMVGVAGMATAIAPVADVLANFATGINTFANLQNIKIVDHIDEKTGKPVYSKTSVNIDNVSTNIGKAITSIINAVSKAGEGADGGDIEDAVDYVTQINTVLGDFGGIIKKFSEIKDPVSVSTNIKSSLESAFNVLSKAKPIEGKQSDTLKTGVYAFDYLTNSLVKLSKSATEFEKFAKAFGGMSKSMGEFTTNFTKLSPTSVTSFANWTTSLTNFAKMDANTFKANMELINKAFGVKDAKQTVAEGLDNTAAGQAINKKETEVKTKAPVAEKVDTTTLFINAINELKGTIAAMSAKLDDLSVRVVGTVATQEQ